MKKMMLILFPAAIAAILLTSFSGKVSRYPGGAPSGYSGSPLDGKDCRDCHGGQTAPVIGWITSDVGSEGYTPGETYTITVTVSGSGEKGFEVSPQNPGGSFLGTLILGSGTEFASGNANYITQSSSSTSDPKVWTFQWTAPAAGSGPVTMYGSFAINKPVTKTSTLVIPENVSTSIEEPEASVLKTYPVPANDWLNIEYEAGKSEKVEILLTDISGRTVAVIQPEEELSGMQNARISTSELPEGTYFIRYTGSGVQFTRKILVSH